MVEGIVPTVGWRANRVIDKWLREMEGKEMNRFLNKQANIYANTDLTHLSEEELPSVPGALATGAVLGGGIAAAPAALTSGVNVRKVLKSTNDSGHAFNRAADFNRAYAAEAARKNRMGAGVIGAGAALGAAGLGYAAQQARSAYDDQMQQKQASATNRFLEKQANIYANTDLTGVREEDVPDMLGSAVGGGLLGAGAGYLTGNRAFREVDIMDIADKMNLYEGDGVVGSYKDINRAYEIEKNLRSKKVGGAMGAGAALGAAGLGYLSHQYNEARDAQLAAKEAFVSSRGEMEKIALRFGRGKAPDEFSQLMTEREEAINAFKQNTARLDQLNPQARADANAAMGAAARKTQGTAAAAGTASAATAAGKAKPKFGKGKLALIGGGAALAAGGALTGYNYLKSASFEEFQAELEKIASYHG